MAKVTSYTITSDQLNQVRSNNPKIKLPTQGTYIPVPGRKFQNLETGEIFTRRVLDNARFGLSQEQRYSLVKYDNTRYYENSKTTHIQYAISKRHFYEATLNVLDRHPTADSFYYIVEFKQTGTVQYRQTETLLRRNSKSSAILSNIILNLIQQYELGQITALVIGVIER